MPSIHSVPPIPSSAARRARVAWQLALIAAASLAAGAAQAGDDDAEREQLARIDDEIARVQSMVSAAAQNAPTGQRVKFRYDWLQSDLQLVREGIRQHADAPRQPRPAPPLRGDYRQ